MLANVLSWSSTSSMAGLLQPVKYVLMSIANLWISTFCLSGEGLKEINIFCCAFLVWPNIECTPR